MRKLLCILLSTTLLCLLTYANERKFSFNHLNIEDGLSSIAVNDIWPDPSGVIWIATSVGLDCYDGNSIVSFCPPQEIHQGLPEIFTKQITGSEEGHLYVLYARHIGILDTRTGEFRSFFSGGCNCITYNNGLWAGHKNDLIYSDSPDSPMQKVWSTSPEDGEITCILHDTDSSIWIGTSYGRIFHLASDFSAIESDATSGRLRSSIYKIYKDSRGTIWAGTLNDGCVSISKDGKLTSYRHNTGSQQSVSSNFVRDFCEDNLGNLWIGTYTGLDCLDPKTGNITRYNPEIMRQDAISHSSIWTIKKDRQGTIWVGTYYGGINYFNPEYDIYNRYPVSNTEGKGLSSPIISKVLEDDRGNLWVATEGGGLNYIDRKSGKTTWFNTDSPLTRRLSENNIKDMVYVPSENAIWVALHLGGINRIDTRTGNVRLYSHDPKIPGSLPSDDILNIADYGDSLIVRAKPTVCIMDKKTGICRLVDPACNYIKQGGYIRIFFVDNDKNIWICKRGPRRLAKLTPPFTEEKEYTTENAKGDFWSSEISGIMQDASGKIWLASSEDGLYVYSGHDDTFTSLGGDITLNGVHHIAESQSSGNIICSSENGFFVFNPVTRNIRRYCKENGFPLKNPLTQCITILKDSEIFIGGYSGLVSVFEKDLDIQKKPYRLFFTSLAVNGEKVETGSEILPESILSTSSITLPAKTRSIELFFSSSNHIAANHDPIEYRLEGFDKTWNPVKGERKISYTNLSAGRYRLLLRPASVVSSYICPETQLEIIIRTPWYATWLAIVIYALLTATAIFFILNFYTSRMQMRELVKHEKERATDLENLNQAKLRFFTNISHEIRTPLTIIIAEIESIIQKHNFSPALYKKVLGIYKNSLSLRELISELMEFRKQEQGQLMIRVAPHNMVFFINEFYLLFSEYASSKGISLSLVTDTERLEVWYDQMQMQKVLNNILSNSIKFTPKGGSISIRIYSTEASAVIEIADTGCGIPEKDLKKIFDRFYQVEFSSDINTGTGIGLALAQGIVRMHSGTIDVESTEGNGSMFRITLPLGYSHFTKEQISGSQSGIREMNISDKISIPSSKDSTSDDKEAEEPKKGHTIVIAEDNQGILDMLSELFSPFYKVISATDGKSALDAVRKNLPSLVLSDVLMPGMNGIQLCKTIKHDPELCHIPVVLLTARVEVEQNMEGLQQGADDYITKPFNSTLLLSRCNNLVNSRIMLQEKYNKEPGTSPWMMATNKMDNDFLGKVTEIISANIDNSDFDISELIKTMGMSRTVFFRKLKAVTGQTPSEFIQTIRLKKGANLLRHNPEMNICEISDIIGFNTPKYFAKCFKEHYGKSPLTYRKENVNNK